MEEKGEKIEWRNPQGNIEYHQKNIERIVRITEREEKGNGTESIFKAITDKNFPNLERQMDIQIHETQKTSHGLNLYRTTLRNIKFAKVKFKEF